MEHQQDISVYLLLVAGTEAMLLISVGIVLFMMIYKRRIVKQNEEKNQLEIMHQRRLAERILASIEKERRRIAADLHDEVGHTLLTLRLNLRHIDSSSGNRLLIDQTINSLRRISFDLYPPAIESVGILPALEDLLNDVRKQNLDVQTDIYCEGKGIPQFMAITLYRIVQELLSNTIKYSMASAITFSLQENDGMLQLRYTDNGTGFDPEKIKTGMGLLNLENRVRAMNGTQVLHTKPGEGFCTEIIIPMTAQPAAEILLNHERTKN